MPLLLDLGRTLAGWRQEAGLTQAALADALALDRVHLWRLEKGRRRTRASTLEEIARVLGKPSGVPAVEIFDSLIDAAGAAIAPESAKSEGSIRRKRKRRRKAALRQDLQAIRVLVEGPDAPPVGGGPELFLRRRVYAAIDSLG